MPSTNDIASQMIAELALTDPQLDTSIGTTARKIVDATASQLSQLSSDSFLVNYQYDIDSKTGGDLDDFCALFGIARLAGTRANGVVTFSRSAAIAATRSVTIGPGTQVASLSQPPIYMQTVVTSQLSIGQQSVDIPVQAVVVGAAGNLTTGAVQSIVTPTDGVSTVINASPIIGGTEPETDVQLRARFKATVFRNLTGTDSMYRAIALQTQADPTDATSTAVSQVNILGSTKHNVEQIQVVSGVATSALVTSAYNYVGSVFVGPSIASGQIALAGAQYTPTVNNAVSPATLTITSIGSGLPDGIYDLEYDYVPIASRNDPFGTRWTTGVVNNRVDLWVNGKITASGSQSVIFITANKFVATAGAALQASRFLTAKGVAPAVNDIFVPLAYGPVLSVPASMVIGVTTYTRGTHYDIVHQNDAFGYTPSSAFGLVFYGAGSVPANNATFSMNYTYNSVPSLVQNQLANWRMVGTDVQVHGGKIAYLQINLVVVYQPNFVPSVVNTAINQALSTFLQGLGFDAAVQVADIIQTAHNVLGVDNVRMATSTDNGSVYAIQLVKSDGTLISTYNNSGRAIDVYFTDDTYPILYNTTFIVKARNTFRA